MRIQGIFGGNSNWALRIVGMIAIGLAASLPSHAGQITNDFAAFTYDSACTPTSQTSCTPVTFSPALTTFGTVSAGGFNGSGGSDLAQTAFFHDHFNLYARGSANTTEGGQFGGGYSGGSYFESVLVTAPAGLHILPGDPGMFELPLHVHGTVTLDLAGFPNNASARFQLGVNSVDTVTNIGHIEVNYLQTWNSDHLTDTLNQDFTSFIPFTFGSPFYIGVTVNTEAWVGTIGAGGVEVGFAESDFSHTGVFGPAIVFDQFGNPVTGATVTSDSGYDYLSPSGAVTAAPEPGTLAPFALASIALAALRRPRSIR
jgi:hypothetical protein